MDNLSKFMHQKKVNGYKLVKAGNQSGLKRYTSKMSQRSITNNVSDQVMQMGALGCMLWMPPAGLPVKVSEPLETHILIS